MMKVSLKDFVAHAEFGQIKLGMSKNELREILGEPEFVGGTSRKYRRPRLWEYGNFEFYFMDSDDFLTSIYSDGIENYGFQGGANIELEPWILKNDLTLAQTERCLKEENISYQRFESKFVKAVILVAQSSVQLGFYQVDEKQQEKCKWNLYNMSYDGGFEPFI